ncbi:endonuclease III [Lignipirellula cremea]|uniref:Endonuclease III n=1 Tax=Lignipirellula cremea TaxID=2528010 RepID=A0A518DSC3_9BACT|nr:endonuclease III [Lignipirellula cremea]QDU94734.1 Ultraviolet N-glycosylase/AP lyase [Lignipirellula cremea]
MTPDSFAVGDAPPDPVRVQEIVRLLKQHYDDAECALHFETPFQLLAAVILSAQCTDERVNMVTPELFRRYPTAEKLARGRQATVERIVHSTGFFRNKAKNLIGCAQRLVSHHGGTPPLTMQEMLLLPGVARKTANVVLGVAYGIASGVVVDTHVLRLSRRLGLTASTTPEKVENDLRAILPQSEWIMFSHRLIHHGRRLCKARKPLCAECPLQNLCPQTGVS